MYLPSNSHLYHETETHFGDGSYAKSLTLDGFIVLVKARSGLSERRVLYLIQINL